MKKGKVAWCIDFFKQLFKKIKNDDVQAVSAQLSFYLILSLFPFLIFIMTLVGYANISMEDRILDLAEILPAEAILIMQEIVKEVAEGRSQALLSFGMLATLWAASKGIDATFKGLNQAYDIEDDRAFWKVRAISLMGTLFIGLVILLSTLLLVFGSWLKDQVFHLFPIPYIFYQLWNLVQYALPLLIMIIVFTMLYWIAPNRKMSTREALPGAIFTTFGWITTTGLFSIYVNQFGDFTRTYGSLGGVMVLLTWLYISSMIILVGGEINATLVYRRGK
ncbi:YihY/virulence factor BrkB family protein [Paenibacillus crassostreae]|uniref:Ribonuclease n=1 Tax=Paenibacillus crassostreae TaxID=1763538 RepID=A0A167FG79_9BACL|nr:YihY/virulence factor BrkB family protein [Paenibacillus crassostreae]AOZ94434.1 ribonuclease [Paenibacillus crassostreae]OAB76529.1 ribonuclease [Paenibacillus crassostreae]